jgi:fructosamine-3-kinase
MSRAGPPQWLIERLGVDTRWTSVAGGDVCRAWRVDRDGARPLFVKHLDDAPDGFFTAEAEGLRFLAEPGAVAVPEVEAVGDDAGRRFLALEWIEPGSRRPDTDEHLGRGLAALHTAGTDRFGSVHDPAYLGSVPVDAAPADTWTAWWTDQRLRPLVQLAHSSGRLDAAFVDRVEAVCERIESLAGPPEPPARVHGDLWAGNLLVDAEGRPWLIDPSAHGGHRETDLAMMRLFGGFSERCFAAYHEVAPLAPGWEQRVPLHQLVPVLVHVILFGGSYLSSLDHRLSQLGA